MTIEPKACPACGGTSGYVFTQTESHLMGAEWGEAAECGDSGISARVSLVTCTDCGARFQFNALNKKGLVS